MGWRTDDDTITADMRVPLHLFAFFSLQTSNSRPVFYFFFDIPSPARNYFLMTKIDSEDEGTGRRATLIFNVCLMTILFVFRKTYTREQRDFGFLLFVFFPGW